MATISAADVKKLRDLTGAGMMDSKNALTEAEGDFDKAVEALRIKAGAKLNKLGSREATNGLVAAAEGAMIQLACETDFVAKNEDFQMLANNIVAHAAATKPADVETLLEQKLADGKTVRENIESVSSVIGEKLVLSKLVVFDGTVETYLHRRNADLPPQVGVLVEFSGDQESAAHDAALQIAAMRPVYVTRDEVPADVVASERRIAEATAREEGKPEQALSRIVDGRLNGFFKDNVLIEQSSVQDSKKTVRQLLERAGVTVTRFARFEVGA
ncbi:MAG TPA: translation elongation factor Ts [Mycobacteriales bacterium]|jgi:elongation factor Ts|nr:translation elongation factor Ts [Mycobacteriales bacterium]